jgi:hypothetical protein
VPIIITDWGFDSYLDLKHSQAFTDAEYSNQIRPDVELLKQFPNHPKFGLDKFWGPASDRQGQISGGFKMKWHNLSGVKQLRLTVLVWNGDFFLCEAYRKKTAMQEQLRLGVFRNRADLIRAGQFTEMGQI